MPRKRETKSSARRSLLLIRQSLILRLQRRRLLISRKRQLTPKLSKPRRMLPRLRSRPMLTRHLLQQLRPLVAMETSSRVPRAHQQHNLQQQPQKRVRLRRPSRTSRRILRTRSRRPQRRPRRLPMKPRSNLKNLPSRPLRRAKMPPKRPPKRPSSRQISKNSNRKLLPLPQLSPHHQHRPHLHQLSPLHLLLRLSQLLPCSKLQLPQWPQLSPPNSEHNDSLVAGSVRNHRQKSIIPWIGDYEKRRGRLSRRIHHRQAIAQNLC